MEYCEAHKADRTGFYEVRMRLFSICGAYGTQHLHGHEKISSPTQHAEVEIWDTYFVLPTTAILVNHLQLKVPGTGEGSEQPI